MAVVSAPWAPAVLPFVIACMVCIVTVPLTMVLARRTGAVAEPDRDRHLHEGATPRLGGLAMMAGFVVALVLRGGPVEQRWEVVTVCVAIAVTMALDDILDLHWLTKLLLAGGAGVAVAATGTAITFIVLPGAHTVELGILAAPVTVAWVVGMQESINLIDGVDGVASGVVAIVAGVMLLAAVNRLAPTESAQDGVIVMAGALIGACIGFLVWNFAPARVFMGDTGSHFLGVALAIMTIQGAAKVAVVLSLAVPLVALGMPIGDTVWAIVRRYRSGSGITAPDAGHIHHRLLNAGFTPRETALVFYLTTGIFGCFALAFFGHRRILAVAVALLVVALVGLAYRNRRRAPLADEGHVVIPGRAVVPRRARHGSEID